MYMDAVNLQEQVNNIQETPRIGDFEFWVEPKMNLDTGKPEQVEFVSWRKLGDRNEARTIDKISRLKGNSGKGRGPALVWPTIEPHYDAWRSGQELEADGTSFDEWKGVDARLVGLLRQEEKIHTVEDFAAVPSHQVSLIQFPNISRWQELAKEFLQKRAGNAELREENAVMRDQLLAMQERLEAMDRERVPLNQGETAEFKKYDGYDELVMEDTEPAATPAKAPAKRKPGRPRKAAAKADTKAA